MKKISAGNVLTKRLLGQVDKAAYQYGGLNLKSDIVYQGIFEIIKKENRAIVLIEKKHIRGNTDIFILNFEKTMNASFYQLELI
jgi:hypothetical protein